MSEADKMLEETLKIINNVEESIQKIEKINRRHYHIGVEGQVYLLEKIKTNILKKYREVVR